MQQERDTMSPWAALGALSFALIVLASLVALGMWGCPTYRVWQQRLEGEAELNRATYNRRIAIQEAEAKREAATALAEAEVRRSEGVAKANKIIGESLHGNEAYLHWLWINALSENYKAHTVVYVPTEAGLPIMEAGRLGSMARVDTGGTR